MKIHPARHLSGSLRLPGDKSISHRAALIAALARGKSRLENFSTSRDCASTLGCLRRLGVSIEREAESLIIEGVGPRGLRASSAPALDCGNSGSTMRMLAGVLAGQHFVTELTGDDSLRSRPMKRIIEPLELMGARVSSRDGCAPLRIEGRQPLRPISYEMPVASAQVKSCVLLAGLNAEGRTEVVERGGPTRDHTERMLAWVGAHVETVTRQGDGAQEPALGISVEGPADYEARDIFVSSDISSAAFFLAAASLLGGSALEIEEVGFNPTRSKIVEVLNELGADVRAEAVRARCNEPTADIHVKGRERLIPVGAERPFTLQGPIIAQLIDELPVLAVVGTQVEGGLRILGARELRVKESDRISTTVENLRAMGAEVEEYDDGLAVAGPTRLRGAELDAHGDHRIAMAFTVAALIAEGESELTGAECVAVSFPEFFQLLESVTER